MTLIIIKETFFREMAVRFLGKKPHIRYVRPLLNTRKPHKVQKTEKVAEEIVEKVVDTKIKEEKTENTDMNNEERLEKIEQVLNAKAPKRKVKVEKKDKGLIERADNATVLLTEDNKMILTD